MLGITDELYMDKEKAKKWFKRMCRIVHPDYGGDANAFVVLTELYKNMIEDDYDDK